MAKGTDEFLAAQHSHCSSSQPLASLEHKGNYALSLGSAGYHWWESFSGPFLHFPSGAKAPSLIALVELLLELPE